MREGEQARAETDLRERRQHRVGRPKAYPCNRGSRSRTRGRGLSTLRPLVPVPRSSTRIIAKLPGRSHRIRPPWFVPVTGIFCLAIHIKKAWQWKLENGGEQLRKTWKSRLRPALHLPNTGRSEGAASGEAEKCIHRCVLGRLFEFRAVNYPVFADGSNWNFQYFRVCSREIFNNRRGERGKILRSSRPGSEWKAWACRFIPRCVQDDTTPARREVDAGGDKSRPYESMCPSDVARRGLYAIPSNALILNAKLYYTIVRGEVVARYGQILAQPGGGDLLPGKAAAGA